MGITPTQPDTNYGYIHRGERLGQGVFEVDKFTEKPNVAAAMKYLMSGEYYWNSGMFAWRTKTVLDQLEKHLPQSRQAIGEIVRAWNTEERVQKLESLYPKLLKISIDFAVMEQADRVVVVEMNCHWIDVGAWPAIEAVVGADDDQNVAACEQVIHLGSRGNIVVTEDKHLIATIGVDDLVIVHAKDATLICNKRDAPSIKELVDNIGATFGEGYL